MKNQFVPKFTIGFKPFKTNGEFWKTTYVYNPQLVRD
jgi:hypothetical protein